VDSQKWVVIQILGWADDPTTSHTNRPPCYEIYRGSDLVGCCKHGNEISGSTEGGEFFD